MTPSRKHHRFIHPIVPPDTRHIPQLGHIHWTKVAQQRRRLSVPDVHVARCMKRGR